MLYAVTPRTRFFDPDHNEWLKPSLQLMPRATCFLLLLLGCAVASNVQATLRQWTGQAPNNNNQWTTPANWLNNGAPVAGDDLLFPAGQPHPNGNNDYPAGTTFNSIELRGGGGGGYNLRGSSIALNAGVQVNNNSGNFIDHTINNSLILNSNQTFIVNNAFGGFVLAGPINLNGKDLTVHVTTSSVAQMEGVISGASPLFKSGDGTLTLMATNTYTGPTLLNAGILQINGFQPASPIVITAGTLKGTGTAGTITATGAGPPGSIVLSPGASPGILTCSNLVLNGSTTYAAELNGTTVGFSYDQLKVNGSVNLGGSTLNVQLGFAPAISNSFTIINNDGADAIVGTFNGLPQGATLTAGTALLRINYAGGNGNDVVLTVISYKSGIGKTWSGAGTNGLWMNRSNWVGNVAPIEGDDLLFPAAPQRLLSTNDFPSDTIFNSITIRDQYLLATLNGAVRINEGVHATFSIGLALVRLPITLTQPQTFFNNSTGELDFSNATIDNGGNDFTVRVNAGLIVITSFLTGGGALVKEGGATLRIGGGASSDYGGATIVNEGTLELAKSSGSAIPHDLIIGDGIGGAGADIVRLVNTGGQISTSSRVTINSSGVLELHALAGQTIAGLTGSGTVMMGANNLVVNLPSGTDVFTGSISGAAGFTKAGAGTLVLGGTNTYSGTTLVSGTGTLQVDGFQPASSVTVNAGSHFQGSGTVGHLSANGSSYVIAPGTSPGILTCSNFINTGSGTLQIELNGETPGTGYDQINARGGISLANLALTASLNFSSFLSNQFVIINNDGSDPVTNSFAAKPEGATFLIGSETFRISYVGGDGNDVVLTQITGSPRPPRIEIERISANAVRLLWPTNPPGFNLECNTNNQIDLSAWGTASPLPTVIGTNNVVTNSVNEAQKLYRLHK